ncbi:MAG: MerR family transcriptional regulator [Rhodospirillaceae bacterium]
MIETSPSPQPGTSDAQGRVAAQHGTTVTLGETAARAHQEGEPVFGISDLAREFDVTHRTIRFYEEKGLLTPTRRGQNRIYTIRDRVRLKLILRGRRLGFSVREMEEMLDLYDQEPTGEAQLRHLAEACQARRAELEQRMVDLRQTIDDLQALEDQSLALLKNGSF